MSPFFGIEVAPGEPAYFRPDDELRTVHLRRATLVNLDDDASAEPARVVVKCRVDRGPSYVLASLVPNRAESVPLDVVFSEDVRISARVVTAAAAAASARRYAVHLTGDVNDAMFDFGEDGDEGDTSSEDESEEEDAPAREATRATGEDDDRGGSSSSDSWGSDAETEDDARTSANENSAAATAKASTSILEDTEADARARVAAARAGSSMNRWVDPIEDAGGILSARGAEAARRWDAPGSEDGKTGWAYHLQTAGARHHRRSSCAPKFAWTGSLRPHLVSPKRSVPSLHSGWLCPLPDYATTGWPEEEFNSRWQRKLEVKSDAAMAKMRAACRLGRHVMDTVARAIAPGVTTDFLDRICHVVTVSNGAYPSPRNYMGFPKSLCTSVNETVCHGIPDARPLEDGDIVNLDVTVCLDGYHGDLNETYFVESTDEEQIASSSTTREAREAKKARAVALMRCARECLSDAIALCAPGARFRDLGEAIQARADRDGFGVVKDFCGHGIGTLFHCAPNVPHYARNKAAGKMAPGMTFTIEPMVNEGSRKCVTWPDGWTAVTADGGRSAQYEHTLAVTETGVEILTERTENSRPLW